MNRYDCTDFKVGLSAYLDGEGSIDDRRAADRHLLECRPCRDLLERAERSDASIREFCHRHPEAAASLGAWGTLPEGFEKAVLAKVRRSRVVPWRRVYDSLGILAAAAAVTLGTALFFVVRARDGGSDLSSGNTNVSDGWEHMPPGVFGPPRPPRDTVTFFEPRAILPLDADEVQALRICASTLAAIERTPFEEVVVRERLRLTAATEELLVRLATIGPKVDPAARRLIDAARASLFQLERDRPDVELWNRLQEDLRVLELSDALDRLSESGSDAS